MRLRPPPRPPLRPCVPFVLLALAFPGSIDAAALGVPDEARVKAIADMLPEKPQGVGPQIGDRKAWQAVAEHADARRIVTQAARELASPMPELPDDLYLEFSRNGTRRNYERVAGARHSRLARLVIAECVEDRGRFLPAIEEAIRAIGSQKAWTLPAHDRALNNFTGRQIDVDLWTAHVSWTLATADWWLGDKLSGEVRKLVRAELERRTFGPMEGYVRRGKPSMWWPTGTNNWNAVCTAGVTGAALATIDDRQRRAFYVAVAERSMPYFLSGFTPDGYCSEGLGYWNYGFGHYTLLAETVFQATGGRIDWFAEPRVREVALFGRRMEVLPGVYPAFADCSVKARPDVPTTAFLSRRLGLGLGDVEKRGLLLADGVPTSLFELGVLGFPNSATAKPAAVQAPPQPLRDWFAEAGILICRPGSENPKGMGVALKGGHNAEHHNHNDVGSFVVALAGGTPLLDPGGEVYTARTFSAKRYESNVLNSFGHPVPRVAGKLHRTGRAAQAKVLKTEFTDRADTLVLDLRSAYDVKELNKLVRTFVFSREGSGCLTVTDEVEFASPQEFGTALITFAKWRREGDAALIVGEGAQSVRVEIAARGGEVKLSGEEIEEDCHGGHPTRLGIDLAGPAATAQITLRIRPAGK